MLTPNYLVGKCVAVKAGSKFAYAESGNADRSVNVVKVTNGRSGGFQQVKSGTKMCKGTISCVYNGDDPPTEIVEGAEITLIIDAVGYVIEQAIADITPGSPPVTTTPAGRLITMQALIATVKDSWNVETDYKWSFDFESTGAYTVVEASDALDAS